MSSVRLLGLALECNSHALGVGWAVYFAFGLVKGRTGLLWKDRRWVFTRSNSTGFRLSK